MLISFCTTSAIFMIVTGIGFALSGLAYFIIEWKKGYPIEINGNKRI